MLGLKRGEVKLCEHEKAWDDNATDTIAVLRGIFGDIAVDIQHVGSTAIPTIVAKPIIDIAVGVKSFDDVKPLITALEKSGFYYRPHAGLYEQMLFSSGSYYDGTGDMQTHFVHVVIFGEEVWLNYINFRDYLNMDINSAKEYENLKIKLSLSTPKGANRTAYTKGKHDFVMEILERAKLFTSLQSKYNICTIEKIEKGWSDDKKYCITLKDNTKSLLRVSAIDKFEHKKRTFELMLNLLEFPIPMSNPIEFGVCENNVYILSTWINGTDAEDYLMDKSEKVQYEYGYEAGQILKKIHSIPAPKTTEKWEIRFNRKIDRNINTYLNCSLKYEKDECVLKFLEHNRYLLDNRPQTYQHGDYHIGNMMIDSYGKLIIIDFDRDDFGDPWEEFNRIVWCGQKAPAFASGMVDGYFDNSIPDEFWRLLALYIASNTLSSLPWAIPFGQGEIDTMINQQREILDWYDEMKRVVPKWYIK